MTPFERAEADEFKKKLQEESKQKLEKVRAEKNVIQQIRLMVNVITPDNFEKKFSELRKMIFGDLKIPGEEGYSQHSQLLTEKLNEENMKIVVEIIFGKAQNERSYMTFYGELCEKMTKIEL